MDASSQTDIKAILEKRMSELPQVVRGAITSADIEKLLRDLANTQKLHLDQWQKLENEVMLALLGFQPIEKLEANFQEHVGVTQEVAHALAMSANNLVFIPIRQELERQLEHPEAKEKQISDMEAAKNMALQQTAAPAPAKPAVQPATPPTPAPDIKITRPSESTVYRPGETSAARAAVADDPYREAPV